MTIHRKQYTKEFKQQAVRMLEEGIKRIKGSGYLKLICQPVAPIVQFY